MSSAKKIHGVIEEALAVGTLTSEQHEWILKEIHRDGTIDAEESALLSELFRATQRGQLVIESGSAASSSAAHRRRTQEALSRDEQNRSASRGAGSGTPSQAQAHLTPTETSQQPAPAQASTASTPNPSSTSSPMGGASPAFEELFSKACQVRDTGPVFYLQNDRLLDVRLEGLVWMKTGAMVGYYGNITFTREGIMEHGLKKFVQRATTGEGSSLTKAIGSGNLYLADQGKKISVIELRGQSLNVNGPNILAFEDCVQWDITFLKQVAAMVTGGLFHMRLMGMGAVALSSHFDPVVLRVTPAQPVMTDYHATVAWSSGVSPTLRTDVSMQTMIGRSSGETVQLAFHGDGFVLVQPFEDTSKD